jgi:hypothetical protein
MLLTLREGFDDEAFRMDKILYDVLRHQNIGEILIQ